MVATLRINHSSSVFACVVYAACALAVCLLFFSDVVLDLDGRTTPSQTNPLQGNVIAPPGSEETEHSYLPRLADHWSEIIVISLTRQFDLASLRLAKDLGSSMLDSARRHGYRLALPRSSTADPSLSA